MDEKIGRKKEVAINLSPFKDRPGHDLRYAPELGWAPLYF